MFCLPMFFKRLLTCKYNTANCKIIFRCKQIKSHKIVYAQNVANSINPMDYVRYMMVAKIIFLEENKIMIDHL